MTRSNNPYFTVWFKPKETINNVLDGEINFKFYIPIVLAVLTAFIGDWDKDYGIAGYLVVAFIGTGLGYFVIGHFFPWLIMKTGKIWNGKGTIKELQVIFGLAHIPILLIQILQLTNLAIGNIKSPEEINYIVYFIASIFSMRTLIMGVSKVQDFTYVQAVVNLILAFSPLIVLELMLS